MDGEDGSSDRCLKWSGGGGGGGGGRSLRVIHQVK